MKSIVLFLAMLTAPAVAPTVKPAAPVSPAVVFYELRDHLDFQIPRHEPRPNDATPDGGPNAPPCGSACECLIVHGIEVCGCNGDYGTSCTAGGGQCCPGIHR
jgi:hypothetical protein